MSSNKQQNMKLEASFITRKQLDIEFEKTSCVRSANEMQEDLKYQFERAMCGLI